MSKIQEELQTIQSQRIDVQLKITQSQENLNNLNVELQEYRRGDPRYVEILKKEFEVNQSKKNLENKFNVLDRNEREVFGLLQSRINVLHDKSRIQFRQLGIVTTLLGAALGNFIKFFKYSVISYHKTNYRYCRYFNISSLS